jgi:fatty-acid desaturase
MRKGVWRITPGTGDPNQGRVVWAPAKALWNGGMLIGGLALAPWYTTTSAVLLFVISTYLTLLFGHSVGMHRRFIHRSFDCPKWLERCLIYVGVLVGMAGPYGILKIHDMRDWAQRLPTCHEYFAHTRSIWRDAFWQLACRFEFSEAPEFKIETEFACDPWYIWMERTWMFHQLPIAGVLFIVGGLPWVVWGVLLRVSVSVVGHWTITYYCHNPGRGRWRVEGAGVQACNIQRIGWVTMGECWHNNHHAFPESARMGLDANQPDPGYAVIRLLERLGLAWNVGNPRQTTSREDIHETRDGFLSR